MRNFSPCLVAPVFMMGLGLATPRGISRGGLLQIGEESQMDVGFQRSSCLLQALASGGFQVEELARLHYPGGTLIEDDRSSKNYYSNALDSTIRALSKSDDIVIYEAAFSYEKLFIRTDIFQYFIF